MVSPEINWDTRTTMARVNKMNIYDYYEDNNFVYSQEVLTRYLISLKTKPFVILSGISGTGKTKIAQLFAEYILQGKSDKDERKAFVSVRPDWTDNRGLLGYYNILEKCYYATPVLRLLLKANDDPKEPYFIILDEMNLARVEHYFSDFLSVMESRTPDKPQGECIELHSLRSQEVLAAESTKDKPLLIPHNIRIPNNVYFTGTINVDESTYMFSPKVLDRANVIEFNEVHFSATDSATFNSKIRLNDAEALNWFHDSETTFCSKSDFDEAVEKSPGFLEAMEALKKALYPFHMHFGYRVANEMARFVNLSRDRVDSQTADNDSGNVSLKVALDIQILQKVLPKFHGTQGKLEGPLNALQTFCNLGQGIEQGDYQRSGQKLTRMLNDLEAQGFCSFNS